MRKLIILLVPGVSFAGGFALSGIGSSGLAGGQAAVADVSDWTAVYWNPAGLADASRSAGFYFALVGTQGKATTNTGIIGFDGPYTLKNYPIYSEPLTFFIPSFGVVVPTRNGTFGFAVYSPFGLGSKWDLYSMPIGYRVGRLDDYPKIDHESSIGVTNIMFSYARQCMFFKNMKWGIALGPTYNQIYLRQVELSVLNADGDSIPDLGYPFSLIPTDAKTKGSGWGFAVNFGMQFDFNKLKAGLAIHYNSSPNLNGTMELSVYKPYSPFYFNATRDSFFLGGIASSTANVSAVLPLPLIADLGFSYKLSDKAKISARFSYQGWNVFDTIMVNVSGLNPITGDSLEDVALVENWKATYNIGLGLEYLYKGVPVRLGFVYDQSPVPDETFTPLLPDPGDKYILTAGFDLHADNVVYGFNFEYFIMPERTVERPSGQNIQDIPGMPGTYSFNIFAFGVTASYRF